MNEIKIVKGLMKEKGKSSAYIAKELYGEGTLPSKVSNRLQSKTMNVETLVQMLTVLDCELIIRDKTGKKKEYVVTNEDRQSVKIYKKDKKEDEE